MPWHLYKLEVLQKYPNLHLHAANPIKLQDTDPMDNFVWSVDKILLLHHVFLLHWMNFDGRRQILEAA